MDQQLARSSRKQLELRVATLAHSLSVISAPYLMSYDYVTLQQIADDTMREPDVAQVVILDKEGLIAGMSGAREMVGQRAEDPISLRGQIADAPFSLEVSDGATDDRLVRVEPVLGSEGQTRWGSLRIGGVAAWIAGRSAGDPGRRPTLCADRFPSRLWRFPHRRPADHAAARPASRGGGGARARRLGLDPSDPDRGRDRGAGRSVPPDGRQSRAAAEGPDPGAGRVAEAQRDPRREGRRADRPARRVARQVPAARRGVAGSLLSGAEGKIPVRESGLPRDIRVRGGASHGGRFRH